jgi:hypothetical protein
LKIMQAIMSIFSRRPLPPTPGATALADPPVKPAEEAAHRVREFQEAVSQGSEVAGRLDKMLNEPADPFSIFAEDLKGRRRKSSGRSQRGKARE